MFGRHFCPFLVVQVFEAVTAKLESIPGLADRVQLFLMGDPTPLTPEQVHSAVQCLPDIHFPTSAAVACGRMTRPMYSSLELVAIVYVSVIFFFLSFGSCGWL